MDPCARIADLCARPGWRALLEAGRAHRTAHRLRDRLVSLAVEILAGAEALDRSVDDARVDLANALHGKPWRSSTPGPKFSTMTSARLINSVRIRRPFSDLRLSVRLRLLQLSIVK